MGRTGHQWVKEGFPVNLPGVTIGNLPAAAAAEKRLHVAMIAPPYFDIPPTAYGGVEAVVADLVDALIDRGQEVTLIGAGRHRECPRASIVQVP